MLGFAGTLWSFPAIFKDSGGFPGVVGTLLFAANFNVPGIGPMLPHFCWHSSMKLGFSTEVLKLWT